MHTGLYRAKPGIGGVVHTHAPYSTALACLGLEIPPVYYLLAALSEEGRVPLAGYATYGTEELAVYASEALGDAYSVCLLQNHRTIAVGETADEAYSLTEMLEEISVLVMLILFDPSSSITQRSLENGISSSGSSWNAIFLPSADQAGYCAIAGRTGSQVRCYTLTTASSSRDSGARGD